MKTCTKCKDSLSKDCFGRNSRTKDKLQSRCKQCINNDNKNYRDKNKDKFSESRRKYYEKNREKLLANKKIYSDSHKTEKAEYDKTYRELNKEKITQYKKEWEFRNKDNPVFKIKRNLRRRLNHALNNNLKSQKTFDLLGCTAEFFKKYIEPLLKPGMSWSNYGSKWHIDHILPCCSFDLSKPKEQQKCFHYTNCQPLWKEENLSKGSKITI
jgi:hypothetical protein